MYKGRVTGPTASKSGGGSNYICLVDNAEYFSEGGHSHYASLYGTEYEFDAGPKATFLNQNVPCAVCEVTTRSKYMMLPGRYNCPSSWNREYYGYLMVEHDNHYRTEYICVDRNPEKVPGGEGQQSSIHMYPVKVSCTGIACPPFNSQKDVTCAFCTK